MHTMLSYNAAVPSKQLHVTKGEPKVSARWSYTKIT